MRTNLILKADSYKYSHWLQYPPGTKYVSSYIESRGREQFGIFGQLPDTEIVHFGLQAFIKEYLTTPIYKGDIDLAEEVITAHGEPFNKAGWMDILNDYGGFLPLRIQGLREGSVIPPLTTQVQVVNTDPRMPWLTSWLETALHRAVWYPSTVATLSREIKKVIYVGLVTSSDDPDSQISFKLHDFGARGASSGESAMLGGMAHLVNFMGSDTVEAIVGARMYYDEPMAAFSIPAAEHSTITAWGRDREVDAYRNMLKQFGGPNKLVAVVSDSYDIYNAVSEIWGGTLKEEVKSMGGTLVIRPDSGEPRVVISKIFSMLQEKFSDDITVNSKGFKVLPSYLRLIQGDGVNYWSIKAIIDRMIQEGWSIDNIAFGMGGALLQKVNRDDLKYAMKANAAYIGDQWVDVYKDPITDKGKISKKGRLAVVAQNEGPRGGPPRVIKTIREEHLAGRENLLIDVYNYPNPSWGTTTFSEIRERVKL